MLLCWHTSPYSKPLWPQNFCQKLSGRASTRPASAPLHRNPCIVQSHLKRKSNHGDSPFASGEGPSRRALVISLIGILQLGRPVLAVEQPGGLSQGGEARSEVTIPALSPEDDRAVPRGVRPGKPLMVQSSDVPLSSSTRSVQESQLSPEAAGKPVDSRATPDSATKPPERGVPKETASPRQPKTAGGEDSEKEAKRLLDEEEERRKLRRRKKGRIRELEEIRAELAEKELVLLSKEQELLERDQTVNVLREELELEKKLRTLLTKEKEKAEEQSALALGLCTGGSIF